MYSVSVLSSLALCLGNLYAWCTLCAIVFGVSYGGRNDVFSPQEQET